MTANAPEKVVKVETIDLAARGVRLPSNRVGMVVAQPYISLGATEPYKCTAASKPQQLKVLTDTLAISRAAGHGAGKTHFTIFPEYTIPGLDGIGVVEAALASADWPNGTIVIGGTDGLSKDDLSGLAGGQLSYLDSNFNALDLIGAHEWINCGITWVKSHDGIVERWLQPKLHPAWEEMKIAHEAMFRGHAIYLFKGLLDNEAPYRFGSLICFDWIATIEAKKSSRWILEDLHQQANGYQIPLSWLFVIQHNPKPSHNTFLREVETFYDQTQFPNALRNNACLVFANNAGLAKPGRSVEYGGTSLIFSDRAAFNSEKGQPTFSKGGARFRDGSDLLNAYKDLVFRERGACIHSFAQINPASLAAGPAGRAFAVVNAHVHPLCAEPDPRTPGDIVPACVKWINDELDGRSGLNAVYPTAPLARVLGAVHEQTIAALRRVTAQSVTHSVTLAAQGAQGERNADEWDRVESEAVEHLVDTLDIVSLGTAPPTVGADPAHATIEIGGQIIDMLAIRGSSHESCIEHSRKFLPLPRRKSLLISRDLHNNPWSQRFGNFLEPAPASLEKEQKFTDPDSGLLHLGFRQLLDIFQQSTTVDAVQGAINAELAA